MKRISQFVYGIFVFTCLAINSLGWLILMSYHLLVKKFSSSPIKKQKAEQFLYKLSDSWTRWNTRIFDFLLPTKVEIKGLENFTTDKWYLMIANHTCWTDILILFRIGVDKLPPLRYVMKEELKWQLPLISQACYALGFPFVKRYSKDFLKKHPEYKGKDRESLAKSIERFKDQPFTVVNFAEGHRFTKERHEKQKSPYQHLLKPKAGGISFIIAAMQNHIDGLINTTIFYPNQNLTLWDYLCGRIDKIEVRLEKIAINQDILGNYEEDPEFKITFQRWVNQLWEDKDQQLKKHYQK